MSGETLVTIIGNLTADPELRFTPSGAAVANFTIASTPRTFDRQANDWKDGDPLFIRCAVWREHGENVAESLTKGARVIAQGFLKMRPYEDREGNKRTSTELDVQDIGPALKYATARVTKSNRGQGGQGGQGGQRGGFSGQGHQPPQGGGFGHQGQQGGFGGPPPGQDPWGGNQGGANTQWDTPDNGEPPF